MWLINYIIFQKQKIKKIIIYYCIIYIMPSKRLSPALMNTNQGAGVKKAGLPTGVGQSVLFKIICKSAGCVKKN